MNLTETTAGHELRARREKLGITRVQLARLCGCSTSTLGYIELGAVSERSKVLARANQALKDIEDEQSPTAA